MMDPQNAYRESAARGATAVGQVVLLYEQVVKDLRLAVRAIETNQIEDRTHAINHALVVVSHLQGTLNFEVGGDVAPNLERFYNMLRRKLVEAQFQTSKEILNEQIALLLDLRDAWIKVDRSTAAPQEGLTETAPVVPDDAPRAAGEWNA
ncbi:MAG: flagellar export chaperone FliS [Candidatus Sulfotelmatobacter sp.]